MGDTIFVMSKLIVLAMIGLIGIVIAQGGSCSAGNKSSTANSETRTMAANNKVPTGVWGGQHIHAQITENGAELEFDCAHGSIPQAITLDSKGRFDVAGKFAAEHPGPVRRDEESNDRAVHYAGSVRAQEMTLTITDTASKEVIGTFSLRYGSEGRLVKCK